MDKKSLLLGPIAYFNVFSIRPYALRLKEIYPSNEIIAQIRDATILISETETFSQEVLLSLLVRC